MTMNAALPCTLLLILAGCAPVTRVTLLAPDGPDGKVEVSTSDANVRLHTPYSEADVSARGSVGTTTTSAARVNRRYATLLALRPLSAQGYTLYFERGGTELTRESAIEFEAAAQAALDIPGADISLQYRVATVDDSGRTSPARQRALAVRALLISKSFKPERIAVIPHAPPPSGAAARRDATEDAPVRMLVR